MFVHTIIERKLILHSIEFSQVEYFSVWTCLCMKHINVWVHFILEIFMMNIFYEVIWPFIAYIISDVVFCILYMD